MSFLHCHNAPLWVSWCTQVTASSKEGNTLPCFKKGPWYSVHKKWQKHTEPLDNLVTIINLIDFPMSWGWRSESVHNHTSDMPPPASVALYSNVKLIPEPEPNSTSSYSQKARVWISDNEFFLTAQTGTPTDLMGRSAHTSSAEHGFK